jgi:TPP-dependent pyruvate/acetoin dehydrogenase alpha subunit
MGSAIDKEYDEAIEKARATPPTDLDEAFTQVYAEPLEAMRI